MLPRLAATLGVAVTDESVEADFGSRLAMRLCGALTPTSKIPIRLSVTAAPAQAGTVIAVEAVSNQGWYAVSLPSLSTRIYNRGALFARLRQAVPPV